jgi:hypothetical protein
VNGINKINNYVYLKYRIRQNMFLIKDKIINKVDTLITQVSSGSLAEGLDLPGSENDVGSIRNKNTHFNG